MQGEEVTLKNKEFELLIFLAENPNIVFSKEKLFDRIWDMESLGDTATVTVHINPVSYTHLDVYKRQASWRCIRRGMVFCAAKITCPAQRTYMFPRPRSGNST